MDRGRQRANRADRSDVENASFALADHLFVDGFRYREQTAHIGIDDFVPSAIGGGSKIITAIDRCIVDENVDATPRLDQLSRQMLHAETIDDRHLERSSTPA